MASIDKAPNGWRARWRTPEGESRSRTFPKKVDAEQWLTHVSHSKLAGIYVDPSAGQVTLSEYATTWLANQVWRPSTAVRVESILTNHVEPTLGPRRMSSITPSTVEAWVKGLTETLAPGTVRGVYRVLVAVFGAVVRDRVVATSPCTGVKLPRTTSRSVEPLTLESVELLADAVGDRYRPLVLLGAGAGLRVGEALGMPVAGIDFLRRQLTVSQQIVTVKRVTSIGPPKTSASVRTVPLAATVLAELATYVEHHEPGADGLMVVDRMGLPVPQNRFSQTWTRAVTRAGLPAGTRFHDLRHTFASALISSGCSVKAVQLALGHESASTTLDTYAHLWPDGEDRTRAAVESFLGGGVSAVCQTEAVT